MIKHKDHFHGSDLEKIEQIYGIKKEEIVSFSANVNPLGVSPLLRTALSEQIDVITTYPDREYTSLRKCIAEYCGTEYENVIVGNGSTELISLFIQIEHPKKAMVIGPTYSEYEREISLGGGTTLYYPLREKDNFRLDVDDFISHLNESIDLIVICNPNNPTSSCITRTEMRHILDACKEHDIYVMVDETYVEFADNMAEISAVPLTNYYNNIVILRDTAYIKATRDLISSERARIYRTFPKSPDFKVYEPSGNFMLVRILKDDLTSQDLFDRAIREKMMIRDCSTFPFLDNKYIRLCIMNPEDNDRLLACLLR